MKPLKPRHPDDRCNCRGCRRDRKMTGNSWLARRRRRKYAGYDRKRRNWRSGWKGRAYVPLRAPSNTLLNNMGTAKEIALYLDTLRTPDCRLDLERVHPEDPRRQYCELVGDAVFDHLEKMTGEPPENHWPLVEMVIQRIRRERPFTREGVDELLQREYPAHVLAGRRSVLSYCYPGRVLLPVDEERPPPMQPIARGSR